MPATWLVNVITVFMADYLPLKLYTNPEMLVPTRLSRKDLRSQPRLISTDLREI
jgi:hypothetical protein